ncbi:MAG TPA: GlxA family transcriptional regulator [Castellaniella sp.]|uniref:GlxA family transcriptional regulator n=1 Tax=Castellaniella sp. TaxID=1955812 RepID=UPI002F13C145
MKTTGDPIDFGFLLIPQFSMLSFAGVLEPLRMANRLAGAPLYRWWLFTPDDQPVLASNGIPFRPTAEIGHPGPLDTLIVVASIDVASYCTPAILHWLRALASRGINLGATSVGPLLLAKAGLLNHRRCTLHWENINGLREEFPDLDLTNELYEIDGKRLTCSGGTAGLDMMMHLIGQRHGYQLAVDVAEQCIHPEIRESRASQRLSLRNRLNVTNPHLVAVIECMELHLEDTLSCDQLARQVGLSVRHMHRLFKKNLAMSPSAFYLDLRLKRARALLEQTGLPISEIALACGFAAAPHFASCYKRRFKQTPSSERLRSLNDYPRNY